MKNQQYALYAAENAAPRGREFASLREIERWVNELRNSWWWDVWYPTVGYIEVGAARRGYASVGAWFADSRTGRLEMAPAHHYERVVLHELAHILSAARYNSTAHDGEFARVYAELVYLVMGSDAWVALQESYKSYGIDFRVRTVHETYS